MAGTTVRLDTTKLNQLIASVPQRRDKLVADAAFLVEQQAKMNIQAWPLIDTGALLNSITTQIDRPGVAQVGDFGGYKGSKPSRFHKKKKGLFRRAINRIFGISGGVEYAVYWELGHHNLFTRHYMRMPFLGPALVTATSKITKMIASELLK